MRILVAYDGSPASERAIEEVVRRPWPAGTQVRLVTIVEAPPQAPTSDGAVYAPLFERIRTSRREEAYRVIRRALEKFRERPELETSYELRNGSAKRSLLETIREWGAELVFTGSQGKGALERFLLGSVSHTLLTYAPCSVEVVKEAGSPRERGSARK
jgi:nucleotide-binding universal stress UspA family protein